MIHIFRKEIKKWHNVLWIVPISMIVGYASQAFLSQPNASETVVASVNGNPITLVDFQQHLQNIHMRAAQMRQFAQANGLPEEFIKGFTDLSNAGETALTNAIQVQLLDDEHERLSIEVDDESFRQKMSEGLKGLLDANGRVNLEAYKNALDQMGKTPEQYEEGEERELKRDLVRKIAQEGLYVPSYAVRDDFEALNAEKSFRLVRIPLDYFVNQVKATDVSDEMLMDYFEKNQDDYRIDERRTAEYWSFNLKDYESQVEVDDESIQASYERNKYDLYSIPPEVQVRTLLISVPSDATDEQVEQLQKKADKLLAEAQEDPESFKALIISHSDDSTVRETGGLVDFFKRGTHDPAFERAAFALHDPLALSGVVRTKDGFQIIQLIDRKARSSKDLSEVRDEIETSLRAKRAKNQLRADLEGVIFRARKEASAIDEFAASTKSERKTTGALTEGSARGYGKDNTLAKEIFSSKPKEKNFGYMEYQGDYVLYREIDRRPSTVPPFDVLKGTIKKDYVESTAKDELAKFAEMAQNALLEGKEGVTLESIAEEVLQKVEDTGLIKESDKIGEEAPGLTSQAFKLTTSEQVLKYPGPKQYYLVVLDQMKEAGDEAFNEKKEVLMRNATESNKTPYFRSFVASLSRSATLDRANILDSVIERATRLQ